MAVYRAELDLSFNNEEDVIAFANLIEQVKAKVFKGTGSESIPIVVNMRYHKCFHDEIPPQPCGDYKTIDFSTNTPNAHKTEAGVQIDPSVFTL